MRQTAQREQLRHESDLGVDLARGDELRHLVELREWNGCCSSISVPCFIFSRRSQSTCVANGRLRYTLADASKRAPQCVVSRVSFYVLQTSSERAWHGEHLCVACVAAQLQLRRHGNYFP